MAPLTKTAAGICVVLCLCLMNINGLQASEEFKVTALFNITANSTCGGDTPTTFVHDGQEFDCSFGEHSAYFSLDNNHTTWWQSNNTDDPVSVSFFLDELEPVLDLIATRIQLVVRHLVASSLHVQLIGKDRTYVQQLIYLRNASLCEHETISCFEFSTENNILDLAFPALDQPVAEISLTLSNDGSEAPDPRLNYYALVEVMIFARVANGSFIRSLDAIRIEGELGIIQATSNAVMQSSNISLFPDFGGRGFAVLNYTESENVAVQWLFPSLPASSEYQIAFLYSSHDRRNRRRPVTLMQGDLSFEARVTFFANCLACAAVLTDSSQVTEPAIFTLTQSMATLTVSLSAVDISLDAIVAIPLPFVEPTSLDDPPRFIAQCDILADNFMDTFCLTSALQLSLEFYLSTYNCSCLAEDMNCLVYGGQCECPPAPTGFTTPIGRQCELCPFHFYHTTNGCNACTCPNLLDDCSMDSGACLSCGPLAFGNMCESCVPNSYDNNGTCLPCNCDSVGTISCNQTTGQCVCRDGVGGETCDRCDDAHFNFTSSGCTSCDCGLGSFNTSCDSLGQCYCEEGVSGSKCTTCSDGFYSLSAQGCLPCFCSNRTDQCMLLSNTNSTEPQELCNCPFPYTGLSCESCVSGYYISGDSGLCERCDCNGRAESCADGSGQCIECTGNSTGLNCEVCIDGTYDADPTINLSCQSCPCSAITASNTSCTVDVNGQPLCHCLPGHVLPLCNNCSGGYFGSPPTMRCSDCSCNGNIDPSVPGSCDPLTGHCNICINNATGSECELCQLGYFGDATIQNCQLCDCYEGGSNDSLCDRFSGQCSCLRGVGGRACNQCQDRFWNFTSGVGCQDCQCSTASIDSICDRLTGQCTCKYGVGGLNCSTCLDGFYDFSANGCSECNCGLGSLDNRCSGDGVCNCLPGATGAKCDRCQQFHVSLSSGCQPCSGCEEILITQLSAIEDLVIAVRQNLTLYLTLTAIDEVDYSVVGSILYELMTRRFSLFVRLESIEMHLDMLNRSSFEMVILQSLMVNEQVQNALERARLIQPVAVSIHEHVLDVHRTMQEVFISTGNVNLFVASISNVIIGQATSSMNMRLNVSLLDRHPLPDLISYHDTVAMLQRARTSMNVLLQLVNSQQTQLNSVDANYQDLNIMLPLEVTRYVLEYLYYGCESSVNVSAPLQLDVASILDLVARANESLIFSDVTIARAQSCLISAASDIGALRLAVSSISDLSGSGDLVSGSGISSEQLILSDSDVAEIISSLQLNFNQLLYQYVLHMERVYSAVDNETLVAAAQSLNSTLTAALELGNEGIQVILDYSYALEKLMEIGILSNETRSVLQYVRRQGVLILDNDFYVQSLAFTNRSRELLNFAGDQSSRVQQHLISYNFYRMQEESARMNSSSLNSVSLLMTMTVSGLQRANNFVTESVYSSLMQVVDELDNVQSVSAEISSTVTSLLNATSLALTIADEIQPVLTSVERVQNATNHSIISAQISVSNRTAHLSVVDDISRVNQVTLGRLNSSLSALQLRLKQALDAAAMIDVALQFNGSSGLAYPLPNVSAGLETVSLVFSAENVSSGDLLLPNNDDSEAVLKLSDGSVIMDYGSGAISVGNGLLQANQWYQVYATKDRAEAVLSLAVLPENGSTITVSAALSNSTLLFAEAVAVGRYYSGCLDRLIINRQQVALLNPFERDRVNICGGPRLPFDSQREFGNGVWLFGAGSYVQPSFQFLELSNMRLDFRTFDESGLLLLAPGSDMVQYLAIYLFEGRLAVDFQLSTLRFLQIRSDFVYNTGMWYEVDLQIDPSSVVIVVNESEVLQASVMNSTFISSGSVIVGGLSDEYAVLMDMLTVASSISGCVRNFHVNEELALFNVSESNRVDFGGCPNTVATGVRFMGNGRAEFSIANEELRNITCAFRSTQVAALLLQFDSFAVSLFHGRLRVDYLNSFILQAEDSNYNDNIIHVMTLTFSSSGNTSIVSLIVDGELIRSQSYPRRAVVIDRVFVGGLSLSSSEIPVAESFRGCIISLLLNGRELEFDSADNLINVSLYGCRETTEASPLPTLPPPPPPPISPPPSLPPNRPVGLSGRDGSFIALQVPQDQVLDSFSIVLEFQTRSSEGVLLHMQGTVYDDFFSLQLQSGYLTFSYDLGSGAIAIRSNASYNDGFLHRVEVWRSARSGQLIVDDNVVANDTSPGTFSALNTNSGYLFVGGVPSMFRLPFQQQPPLPVVACFTALSINGVFEDLATPQASSGVEQCLPFYNNVATLHRDSYLLMRNNFDVGIQVNISLDFRTYNCSSLLLYVPSSFYPDHLLVELRNGCVMLVFDNGPMREELEYCTEQQLCDGAWHSLLVMKNGLVGGISVDTNGLQTVVSSCEVCQHFFAVNTDGPLYVGGIPSTVRSRYTGSFEGCLGNFYIHREGRAPEALIFSQAIEQENVVFDTCISTN